MFALKYFQANSNALSITHIAIIIEIFGIPLESEIGTACAFNVASAVVVFCIDLFGLMVIIRVLSVCVTGFGLVVVVVV